MTLHVVYDHQCSSCGAYYIPYDENVPCPNCGIVEDDRFDYIPKAVESILFNLEEYGSYVPPAWWVGSLGDHILHILFGVFEQFRESKETDFDTFVKSILSKMEWKDQKYLEKHVHSIAVRIHEEIKKKKEPSTAYNRTYLALCLRHSAQIPRSARNFRYAQPLCAILLGRWLPQYLLKLKKSLKYDQKILKIIYSKLPLKYKLEVQMIVKARTFLHKNIFAEIIRLFFKNNKKLELNLFEQRFYSQNGEDGIIRIIFDRIKTTNKFCVEFGIHPFGGNTIYLKKNGWNCLWMDANGDGKIIKKEFITAENINSLFEKYKVPKTFDLLSIDIDGNDYWVWKAITNYSPRVVVIEYNSSIPTTESKTIRYDPKFSWDGTNYFGASLLALEKLGKSKGYTLIACDSKGVNAFFVRNDLIKNHFELKKVEQIYKPPKYGKKINGKYIGHPPSNKKMVSV